MATLSEARFIYRALVALVTQKSLLPRTIVATKTKKGRAACALLWLLLWSCFFYQNAAVFYLNVDGAKFSILAMKKRALAAKITRVFFCDTRVATRCVDKVTLPEHLVVQNHSDFCVTRPRAEPGRKNWAKRRDTAASATAASDSL